jgi:hypothetical protein
MGELLSVEGTSLILMICTWIISLTRGENLRQRGEEGNGDLTEPSSAVRCAVPLFNRRGMCLGEEWPFNNRGDAVSNV